jgi:Ser/Thr protein kinase RdoA (MazF antagonist)
VIVQVAGGGAVDGMAPALRAATDVGRQHGVHGVEPVVLQETNNTVVWLAPEPVVAKVATRADARRDLCLEHAVATELLVAGGEIAPPLPGAGPAVHAESGCVVTLWQRVEGGARVQVAASDLAASLRRLHGALARTGVVLPSFRLALERARAALDDDAFMASLGTPDRSFLRRVYDDGLRVLDGYRTEGRRLHGEPHDGNRLVAAGDIRWIDFESCCVGPLEWDLAFQPVAVADHFPEADAGLLRLLRRLNSARVATWCWGQARFPEMRRHGEVHLALLRSSSGGG